MTLNLGLSHFQLESKITLAIGGIIIVLVSVLCSLGLFGYVGLATTMLTVEVIPFLVLAVGVDNIFILVHTHNGLDKREFPTIAASIGEALGRVGPSILLTSASECFCFLIGAFSDMPAVRTFAFYATVAIFLDFILQITVFIALMSLDEQRTRNGRLDLLCFIKTSKKNRDEGPSHGFLHSVFRKYYTPTLMSDMVRPAVAIVFILWACFSLMVVPSIELGLDQELSMPKDSHIVKYFQFMAELFAMGPPVYWVLKPGLDYTDKRDQNVICGGIACNDDSMITQLFFASKYPEV
jgi:Niemann-Pick C1 protein